MQNIIRYVQRKWKFILVMSILLALNYFAWSWLWQEPNEAAEPDEQADLLPTNIV